MGDTIKEQAISATAGELRLSETMVRMVVGSYDANRKALGRARSGSKVRPKSVGGGWYLLPNGDRVQGKAKAEQAMKALADE